MNQRIDALTNVDSPSSYMQVLQAHHRLNKEIDDLSTKFGAVIDKNQAQFLIAYQNHIRKIKIELNQIKSKTDAQEKQMSKNDRVNYLEKQVTLFREQALKLYDRLQEKTQEAEIFKLKSKQLEKTCFVAQKQVKQHMRQRKQVEAKLIEAEGRIVQLEQQLKSKNNPRRATYSEQSNTKSVFLNNLNLRLKDQQSKQVTASKTVSLGLRRKSINYSTSAHTNNRQEGDLKDWFLECVKTIKRDVAQRKNSGQQMSLDYIKNIQEFKMVDKLKLLEKFMENEKLLIWMYEKIFPSRLEEVKDYLTKNTAPLKKNSVQSDHIISQADIFNEIAPQKVQLALPKMTTDLKPKKTQIRNKISIRDGKLNLTML